jgi:ATP-dependent DNA ligase
MSAHKTARAAPFCEIYEFAMHRMPNFDRIRYRRHDATVFLYAFDLIELNGADLRREPHEVRKATLASVLAKAALGLRLNEHIEADGPTVFAHACKMGLEGIVSKRKGSPYRGGRSLDWLKMKNPAAPAVKREAEEDWNDWSGSSFPLSPRTRGRSITTLPAWKPILPCVRPRR